MLDHVEKPHRIEGTLSKWGYPVRQVMHEKDSPGDPPGSVEDSCPVPIHARHLEAKIRKVRADRSSSTAELEHSCGRHTSQDRKPLRNEVIASPKPEVARFSFGQPLQSALIRNAETRVVGGQL